MSKAEGRPWNKESKASMHKAKRSAGSGSVKSIEEGHVDGDVTTGYEGSEGIRFHVEGPILDHSMVRETIGKE